MFSRSSHRMRTAAAVLAMSGAGLFAFGSSAGAAPRSSCDISGTVTPAVAARGENVTVTATVRPGHGQCRATSMQVTGGPFVLRSADVSDGYGGCTITFAAFDGLSAITVTLDNGQRQQIGTVTVLSPTPTSHARSTAASRTAAILPPASRAAASASAAAASRAAAAASAARTAGRTRTSTVTSTAFPSDSAAPTSGAAATDTAAPTSDSATGFSVNVRTDPSGGSSIPAVPLLLALLVLAGFLAAAVRLIYTHLHEEIEA